MPFNQMRGLYSPGVPGTRVIATQIIFQHTRVVAVSFHSFAMQLYIAVPVSLLERAEGDKDKEAMIDTKII